MPRSPRCDEPEAVFHVTARVNWRAWLLAPSACAERFLALLARFAQEMRVNLLGLVLMSNHYHFVAQSPPRQVYGALTSRRTKCRHLRAYPSGHPKASVMSQFLHKLMQCSSRSIQGHLGLSGRFWEDRYHAGHLPGLHALVTVLAYDHLNPVIAGIVTRPEEYERSSAASWAGSGDAPIPLAQFGLPFGVTDETLRRELAGVQQDRALRAVFRRFNRSGLLLASSAGQVLYARLLAEHGLARSADCKSAPWVCKSLPSQELRRQ